MSNLQTTPPAGTPAPVRASKTDRLTKALNDDIVKKQFENALKENKDAFVASLIDLYATDSKLQECAPAAVIMEALKSAVLKLPINKSLGFSWIIPYARNKKVGTDPKTGRDIWDKVQIPQQQIGYKGYIQLALRTGQYRHINTDIVYEGQIKSRNKLTGEISFNDDEPAPDAKPIGYFAYIELMNGFSKIFYSTEKEVRAHAAKYSKSYDLSKKDNIWVANFDEMAKKTVLRYLLSHYGYLSTEMVVAMDNELQSDSTIFQMQEEIDDKANKEEVDFDDYETQGKEEEVDFDDQSNDENQLGEGDESRNVPAENVDQPENVAANKKPGSAPPTWGSQAK